MWHAVVSILRSIFSIDNCVFSKLKNLHNYIQDNIPVPTMAVDSFSTLFGAGQNKTSGGSYTSLAKSAVIQEIASRRWCRQPNVRRID